MSVKEAIEYVCQALAYFGIQKLNPEAFRRARSNESEVIDRFWLGLFDLIILHLNGFKHRLAHKHSLDVQNIQPLVIYILHKWNCPIEISLDSSKLLLISLGYVIDYVNLFQLYEDRYSMSIPPYPTPEEMHEPTLNYITQNLPSYSKLDYPTILSLYNSIQKRIFSCFEQIRYCNFLIHKSKSSFPKAEIEELWVAKSEERVQDYENSLEVYEKNQIRREEELKHRTVFWSWLNTIVDTIQLEYMETEEIQEHMEFPHGSIESLIKLADCLYREVSSAWKDISYLLPKIQDQWDYLKMNMKTELNSEQFLEMENTISCINDQLSIQMTSLDELVSKYSSSSNIPPIIPLSSVSTKDRCDGEEVIFRKLTELEKELNRVQEESKQHVISKLSLCSSYQIYNY